MLAKDTRFMCGLVAEADTKFEEAACIQVNGLRFSEISQCFLKKEGPSEYVFGEKKKVLPVNIIVTFLAPFIANSPQVTLAKSKILR